MIGRIAPLEQGSVSSVIVYTPIFSLILKSANCLLYVFKYFMHVNLWSYLNFKDFFLHYFYVPHLPCMLHVWET